MKLVLCHWLIKKNMIYTGNVFGMGRIKNIPYKFARGQELLTSTINHKHPKF